MYEVILMNFFRVFRQVFLAIKSIWTKITFVGVKIVHVPFKIGIRFEFLITLQTSKIVMLFFVVFERKFLKKRFTTNLALFVYTKTNHLPSFGFLDFLICCFFQRFYFLKMISVSNTFGARNILK